MSKKCAKGIAVIKIGSSLIVNDNNQLRAQRIRDYISQIMNSELRKKYDIILVSSGSIPLGKHLLNGNGGGNDPEGKLQEYASIGQPHLIHAYQKALDPHKVLASQILVTKRELQEKAARAKILATLDWNRRETRRTIIPIVNENDTVATDEFATDNDDIASKIAQLVSAKVLLLLTHEHDGVLKDIHDPDSVIRRFPAGSQEWEQYIVDKKNVRNRGGMTSKCASASECSAKGIQAQIVKGLCDDGTNRRNVILRALLNKDNNMGTTFEPGHVKSKFRVLLSWILRHCLLH